MDAIRIRTHLASETITLPELKPLIGQDVEICVEVALAPKQPPIQRYPLWGTLYRFDQPFDPAASKEEWEVLK